MLWQEKCQTAVMLLALSILLVFISVIGFQTVDKGIQHLNQVQTSYSEGKVGYTSTDDSKAMTREQPAAISTMAPVRAQDIVKGKANDTNTLQTPKKNQKQTQTMQVRTEQSQSPTAHVQANTQKTSITMTNGLFIERAGVGMGIVLKKGARETLDHLLNVLEGTKNN